MTRTPSNAPPTAITSDHAKQMDILDKLPAALRRVVLYAPIPLDLAQVRTMRNDYGLKAPARLIGAILREYPTWHMGDLNHAPA